ncbi:MAG: hypothetical protein IKZ99_12960 [Salinivirgaceae bacterium]|nr:hypothetical protein [Salinivirgaceae bacterium]
MNREEVIEQIKSVPEEYLDEISQYISDLMGGNKRKKKSQGLREFYGIMNLGDGLEIQKQMRNEWNRDIQLNF